MIKVSKTKYIETRNWGINRYFQRISFTFVLPFLRIKLFYSAQLFRLKFRIEFLILTVNPIRNIYMGNNRDSTRIRSVLGRCAATSIALMGSCWITAPWSSTAPLKLGNRTLGAQGRPSPYWIPSIIVMLAEGADAYIKIKRVARAVPKWLSVFIRLNVFKFNVIITTWFRERA